METDLMTATRVFKETNRDQDLDVIARTFLFYRKEFGFSDSTSCESIMDRLESIKEQILNTPKKKSTKGKSK